MRNACKPYGGRRQLGVSGHVREGNNSVTLRETEWEILQRFYLAQGKDHWRALATLVCE
jgi:hypothetical protein